MKRVSDEFEVILEAWPHGREPKRSRIAASRFAHLREARLREAATLTRLEVARLAWRGVGLTREELSARSGVSVATIERAEAKKPRQISDDNWIRLATALAEPRYGSVSETWHRICPTALRLG